MEMIESALACAALLAWLGSGAIFIYIAPMRRNPEPATGRVYPWPNHGTYAYLSAGEDCALRVAWTAAAILLIPIGVIEWKRDPWKRRKR